MTVPMVLLVLPVLLVECDLPDSFVLKVPAERRDLLEGRLPET